jgi:hypothetical protein
MKVTRQEYMISASVSLVVLVLSFFLHLKWCGTTMAHSEKIWQDMLHFHLSWYPFSVRYFTSYPVLIMHELFSWPVRESFFILQFSVAFLLGPCFYRYLRTISFNQYQSYLGTFLLLSSYPILCAHFEPVHTWDDFWAYLFVTLALTSVIQRRLGPGMVFFTLGCFAREQTLLFYPVFIMAAALFVKDTSAGKKALWLMLPLAIYGIFTVIVWEAPEPKRFRLIYFNFEQALRTRDTLFSLFISFGFIWFAAALHLLRSARREKTAVERLLSGGAVFIAPVTVAVALFFTLARETRILFPPFVFLIPLALGELTSVWYFLRRKRRLINYITMVVLGGILMAVGFYLGKRLFPGFEYRQCARFAQQWSGFQFGIILNLLLVNAWKRFFRLQGKGVSRC